MFVENSPGPPQEVETMKASLNGTKQSLGRRDFLRTAGAGMAGASLLTAFTPERAPAQIKGTSLRILQWSHFVPAYDTWFDEFVKKWGDQVGVKVRVDRIPHLELPS